jgi:hypothetical protein
VTMSSTTAIVVAGVAMSLILYATGIAQIKRTFPRQRGNWIVAQCVVTLAGGLALGYSQGLGLAWCAITPACVATVCFIAGKGSVAVLIHEDADGPMSAATSEARRRFGILATTLVVGVLVVGFVVVFF